MLFINRYIIVLVLLTCSTVNIFSQSFEPTDISSLKLWLSADSVELVENTVAIWYDKSGNNFNAEQINPSQMPTFIDGELNNQPVLRFTGGQFLVSNFGQTFEQPNTIFIIMSYNSSISNQYTYDGISSSNRHAKSYTGSNSIWLWTSSASTRVTVNISPPFSHKLFTDIWNTSNSKVYLNGILTSSGNLGSHALTGLTIGTRNETNQHFLNGDIAEIVFYNGELSEQERQQVENFLMDKYSPTLSLGEDICVLCSTCDTVLTVPPSFNNILWSTGETSNSITISESGQYYVQAEDNFGRLQYDTVNVSFFNTFISDQITCPGDSVPVSPEITGDYSYLWSNSTTGDTAYFSEPGNYWVEITDSIGCIFTLDFNVSIDSFTENFSLGNDTTICAGNFIKPISGTENITEYLWLPNEITDSIIYIYESGQYNLIVQNINGCIAEDSVFVTVQGVAPIPDFTVQNLCFNDTTIFMDISFHQDSIASRTWIFNNIDTLHTQAPEYVFQNIGQQTVQLIIESFGNCISDTTIYFDILSIPEVSFSYFPVCADIPVEFYSNIIIPTSETLNEISWYINNEFINNSQNLIHNFNEEGNFSVKLEVELDNNCSSSYSENITVSSDYPLPEEFSLLYPGNNAQLYTTVINFQWSESSNALFYELIIAEDSSFQNIVITKDSIFSTNETINIVDASDSLVWKVIAYNACLNTFESDYFSFSYFSPAYLPDIQLWLSADSVEIIDGKVVTWYDKSGNNNHAQQLNFSNQPLFLDSTLNSLPVISFDGHNNFLQTVFEHEFNQPNTFFILFNSQNTSVTSGIFDGIETGFRNTFQWVSGGLRLTAGSASPFVSYNKSQPFNYITSTIVFNESSSMIFENSVLKASGSVDSNPISGFQVGRRTAFNPQYFNGNIAEIIFYDSFLADSDRLAIENYLMNKYAVKLNLHSDIYIDYGFCDLLLEIDTSFSNILWSTGDTVYSTIITESGQYYVQANDIFGRTQYDTVNVYFPVINIEEDILICFGDSIHMDTGLGEHYSYLWSTGSEDEIIYISEAGEFWVQISDTLGCSYTYFFNITVDSFPQSISLGNDITFCAGNYISLIEGSENVVNYTWLPCESNDSILYIYESGMYHVITNNINACIATDSIYIDIQGVAPVPNFTAENFCLGDITIFTDLSFNQDSIAYRTWVFNDTDSLFSESPQYIFPNNGDQKVQLIVESFGNCVADTVIYIEILDIPQIEISYMPPCSGLPASFYADITPPQGETITSVSWLIDGVPVGSEYDLIYNFQDEGEYLLSFIAMAENGCSAYYEETINVFSTYPPPGNFQLVAPIDNIYSSTINFQWIESENAVFYKLLVSASQDFSDTLLLADNIYNSSYLAEFTEVPQEAWWIVKAFNPCLDSISSDIATFTYFAPYLIPNMQLWFDAQNVEIIDGAVATIFDLSSNQYHALQEIDIHRPTRIDSALNHFPVISFDGNNNYLQSLFSQEFSQPNTFFIIWKNNKITGTSGIFDGTSEGLRNTLQWVNGGLRLTAGASSPYVSYNKSQPFNYILSSICFNESNTSVYENGLLMASGIIDNNSLSGLQIGRRTAFNTQYFEGKIAEIIFYDTLLTDSQREQVEEYLITKYMPELDLGPDIIVDYGFCPYELSIDNNFENIYWSTGDTTHTISVNQSGQYTVSAWAFGRIQFDTVNIVFPEVQMPQDNMFCFGEDVIWDTGLSQETYFFEWQGQTETGPALSISQEGYYSVIVSDTLGCQFQTDSIYFDIDYYELTTSIGPADTSLCIGNRLFLLTNADETISYIWNTGSTEPEIILEEGGHYSVTATNYRGCIAESETNVNIIGVAPQADFFLSNHCEKNNTIFNDNSTSTDGNIISRTWSIDNQFFSSSAQPQHTFQQYGIYNIKLEVQTDQNCSNFIAKDEQINPLPIPDFGPDYFCENNYIELFTKSNIPQGSIISNIWTIENQNYTDDTISYYFASEGFKDIKLVSQSDMNCYDSIVRTIEIRNAPLPEFTLSPTCQGETVYFINNSQSLPYNTAQSWYWDFGDQNYSANSNPEHQYDNTGTYNVVFSIAYLNGCVASREEQINVYPNPIAKIENLNACINQYYSPGDISESAQGEIVKWHWEIYSPQNQFIPEIFSDQNPSVFLQDTGTYHISLEIETEYNCIDSKDTIYSVTPESFASFETSRTWGGIPFTVDFTNNSINAQTFLWDFGDGNFSDEENPQHTYLESGNYEIILYSYTEYNCADTAYAEVRAIIPVLDIMLHKLEIELENNYLKTTVTVFNIGTLPVSNLELQLSTGTGNVFKETIDYINAGEVIEYEFQSQIYRPSGTKPELLCVTAYPPPVLGHSDINMENNILCSSTIEGLKAFPPYPNPVSEILYFDFFSAKESDIQVRIINGTGNTIYSHTYKSFIGHKKLETDIKQYASGIYFITISDGTNIFNYRFVIN